MYELPPEFHEDLWANESRCHTYMFRAEVQIYRRLLVSPLRTMDSSEANFFYVPMFSMCHFDPGMTVPLQKVGKDMVFRALDYVRETWPYWSASDGADHIITLPGDYGGCFNYRSYLARSIAMDQLGKAILLTTLGEHGQPCYEQPRGTVVLPPTPHVPQKYRPLAGDAATVRPIFASFRGACHTNIALVPGYRTRNEVVRLFGGEPGFQVNCKENPEAPTMDYLEEMRQSTFCITPAGHVPWSARMIEAVLTGCIPVLLADNIVLPFERLIDWDEFVVRLHSTKLRFVPQVLRSYSSEQIAAMQAAMAKAAPRLEFQEAPVPGTRDAFHEVAFSLRMLRAASESDQSDEPKLSSVLEARPLRTVRVIVIYGSSATGKTKTGKALTYQIKKLTGQTAEYVEMDAFVPSTFKYYNELRKGSHFTDVFKDTLDRLGMQETELPDVPSVQPQVAQPFQKEAVRALLRKRAAHRDTALFVMSCSFLPIDEPGFYHQIAVELQRSGVMVEFFKVGLSINPEKYRNVLREQRSEFFDETVMAEMESLQASYESNYNLGHVDFVIEQFVDLEVRGEDHPFLRIILLAKMMNGLWKPGLVVQDAFQRRADMEGEPQAGSVGVFADSLKGRTREDCARLCLQQLACKSSASRRRASSSRASARRRRRRRPAHTKNTNDPEEL